MITKGRGPRLKAATRIAVLAVTTVGALLAFPQSSGADVSEVKGSAYGYYGALTMFTSPLFTFGPDPVVTLPPGGSPVPLTASAPSGAVQVGPGVIFTSGPLQVSTQGTVGPGGSVTSTSSLQNINRSRVEVFTAASASSTCTATEAGVSGSTTINGGVLETSQGNPDVDGDEVFVKIPTNPPPNLAINGNVESVGDRYQYIFNEQIVNPDGSLTVYAGHLRLLGPLAVGDVFWGKSECGVTTPLICSGQTATVVGTAGKDFLTGTSGRDVVVGLGGDDQIAGMGGDDVICGGDGNDRMSGGDGNDRLFGGPGNDDLSGGFGNDTLNGEAGTNRLAGGGGTDTCTSGTGDTVLTCET